MQLLERLLIETTGKLYIYENSIKESTWPYTNREKTKVILTQLFENVTTPNSILLSTIEDALNRKIICLTTDDVGWVTAKIETLRGDLLFPVGVRKRYELTINQWGEHVCDTTL